MCDGQVVLILDEGGGAWLVSAREESVEVEESLAEGLDLFLLAFYEDLEGEHLVGRVVLGDEGHAELGVGLCSCCEVASLDCGLNV